MRKLKQKIEVKVLKLFYDVPGFHPFMGGLDLRSNFLRDVLKSDSTEVHRGDCKTFYAL